ncbi:GtrA family protein [Herbivorax sp. ANBcel31]|uniref:GtrA family protein n=1 Tax=Herbivorax sp. ANBcel31 TaxID=3069754 RepID=UPI0027B0871B|nr:GtrA family protein [Herbivorax sp. ANBcel31]MDQ2088007.1 GtrA family protein [Herbivorax sp. ANBcel31]
MISISVKYTVFAILSTIGNLTTQHLVNLVIKDIIDDKYVLYVSMFFGTLVGLIIKYILDKKYIFNYHTKSQTENAEKFVLYSFMGVFTTAIFWVFEISFDKIFDHNMAKYVGAVIGLSIGYIVKYNLDKKFVFSKK